MIFGTVGTHEQQFDRFVRALDQIKAAGIIDDDIIIQTGYSDYKPEHCKYSAFFPYQQVQEYVEDARIVITHGGPSSIFMSLRFGKIPVVIPRQKEFGEHVNNHQVKFCQDFKKRYEDIIVVTEIDQLKEVLESYDRLTAGKAIAWERNNSVFCDQFEKIIHSLMPEKL